MWKWGERLGTARPEEVERWNTRDGRGKKSNEILLPGSLNKVRGLKEDYRLVRTLGVEGLSNCDERESATVA